MICFRVEAGHEVGLGHLFRCMPLAEAVREAGLKSAMILPTPAGASISRKRGLETQVILGAADAEAHAAAMARWLLRRGARVLVVDSYALSLPFYRRLRELWSGRLFAIDDGGEKKGLPLDGIISFGFGSETSRTSRELSGRSAVGVRFTPLRDEFLRRRARPRFTTSEVRLLVMMGGSDPEEQTARAVGLLKDTSGLESVTLVLGPLFDRPERLDKMTRGLGRFRVLRAPKDLPAVMLGCDAAFTSAGYTCHELAHLGVPMLALPLTKDQERLAKGLARAHAATVLPRFDRLSDAALRRALDRFIASPSHRRRTAANARRSVDGRGAERIADFLVKAARRTA